MDETMDKKRPLSDLMRSTMDKIREMADTNTIVGQPITTPDGVTLIPISRVSMGFGCGGADYGKAQPKDFGGGSGAGVKIDHQTNEVMGVADPAPAAGRLWDRLGGPVQSISLSGTRSQYFRVFCHSDGRGQRPGAV